MKLRIAVAALLLLAGIARAQTTHQAVLSWGASTGTVTGYNVYKLTGVCPATPTLSAFTKLAATNATTLTYTDTVVTAGTTYCYVVTAFSAGGESGFSGTWQGTIPVFTASTIPTPPSLGSGTVQ